MHKLIKAIAIALTALNLTTATTVQAQGKWVRIATSEYGNQIFFDTASQVRLFDAGVKQNTFFVLTLNTTGKRSFRQQYQADCFNGTLTLNKLDLVDAQGSSVWQVPLDSADKIPYVPAKDTIASDIWRHACAQF